MASVLFLIACQRPEPLTAQKAEQILRGFLFEREPVYAEVPQKVWWDEQHPKDDFDEKSVRTLLNLEKAGYLTVEQKHDNHGSIYIGKVTEKGFPIIGTAPSARGPAFRGMICYKKYDGIRNFQRHPTEPTVGHAELVWHYADPTPLYPLFETKLNKPLDKPFVSLVSFYFKDHEWKFDVTVRKAEAAESGHPARSRRASRSANFNGDRARCPITAGETPALLASTPPKLPWRPPSPRFAMASRPLFRVL